MYTIEYIIIEYIINIIYHVFTLDLTLYIDLIIKHVLYTVGTPILPITYMRLLAIFKYIYRYPL